MKSKGFNRNDPSLRRGRRTNDTIVSAVIHTIPLYLRFVKPLKWNGGTVWNTL